MSEFSLNEQQSEAVTTETRQVIVYAGPGTGKTKTLTARIAHLVKVRKVPARHIMACTFSRKAAHELQERIRLACGDDVAQRMLIGTFHALALRMLRSYRRSLVIVDDERKRKIIKQLSQEVEQRVQTGDLYFDFEAESMPSVANQGELLDFLALQICAIKNDALAQKDQPAIVQLFYNLYDKKV